MEKKNDYATEIIRIWNTNYNKNENRSDNDNTIWTKQVQNKKMNSNKDQPVLQL